MRIYAFVVAVTIMISASGAFCDETKKVDKAKEHFLKGKAFVEEGTYEKAIIELKASYDLNPVPMVLYNIAVCYDKLHKYADAVKYFNLYLIKGKDEPKDKRQSVSERLMELKNYLGQLVIHVDVEGAEIIIDGQFVASTPCGPIFIETGDHDLTIRKTGFPEAKKTFTIVSGETTEISISISGSSPESKKKLVESSEKESKVIEGGKAKKKTVSAPVFWSLIGLTGAAAIATIATGAMAVKKDKEAAGMFTDEPGYESVRDEGKKLALTTDVLIGISAGAAIASLVTAFFTNFKKEKKVDTHVSPLINGQAILLGFEGGF